MRYRFDGFELDTQRFVLRTGDREIHVEPLVFDLLCFLVEHAGEVVTREAIIEQVWEGRIVSDATVSSCIKSVRKALGDDGAQQRHLRTIRARGFQFTASVERLPAAAAATTAAAVRQELACAAAAETAAKIPSPPRIAVLPLFPLPQDPELGLLGDALAQEVILELSRLHWLAVIARGSTFKFRGQEIDLAQAGQILGATYILTGTIMRHARSCVVAVELCRAADSDVVWAERFTTPTAELMHMRSVLAGKIVASLEPRVQHSEAVQAAHVPTEELDAWAAYHRGIMHMYRFNQHDNALAAQLFARAVSVDPGFARGHAGLSFTHFQNAFLGFSADVEGEVQRAHAQAIEEPRARQPRPVRQPLDGPRRMALRQSRRQSAMDRAQYRAEPELRLRDLQQRLGRHLARGRREQRGEGRPRHDVEPDRPAELRDARHSRADALHPRQPRDGGGLGRSRRQGAERAYPDLHDRRHRQRIDR